MIIISAHSGKCLGKRDILSAPKPTYQAQEVLDRILGMRLGTDVALAVGMRTPRKDIKGRVTLANA